MNWTSGTVIAIVAFVSISLAIMVASWALSRYLTSSRNARAELTTGQEYRGLADEFRRLSDMAITAQEHVDLRLTDLGVQVEALRDQMEQMQRILKEVE
ncbi:MAG: hypothetical protein ACRDOB_03925 [Streptosporangiaceae bacterium]